MGSTFFHLTDDATDDYGRATSEVIGEVARDDSTCKAWLKTCPNLFLKETRLTDECPGGQDGDNDTTVRGGKGGCPGSLDEADEDG